MYWRLLLLFVGALAYDWKKYEGELKKEWERLLTRGYPETMVYDKGDFNTLADVINPNGAHKNSILWESLVHAREWLAGATLMNILDKMITEYGTDEDVTRYLDNYDFHFIPVMNPDGYKHSWDDERMWRKNRRNNEGSLCFGVDLNRNYDNNWGAASEPETQTVVDYVMGNTNPAWLVDVSMHTYGQYLLTPYGDCSLPPNWDTGLSDVVRLTCLAIEGTYNTRWDCGNSCEVLYASSGGSVDWMMATAGMPYTFVPELRGNGFDVSPSLIPLSFQEMWNGLVAMMNEIMSQNP
ncbi:hypothetical protein LSH36_143g01028 [Paralvinella palmiformis]|uniref:Peptidase M14 domain-containing protein n=1 Tax=Paralvinella palmiformis TaxID=53620 RepID=A0AAD9JW57_9ANNE|nr:hypothetical protein LSH36_143g01028 [Paralvinella palmiformis]